jgi:hypothetical protein
VPHVVLNGKISIEEIFNRLPPLFIRNEALILRTMDIYLARGKHAILIESLALEASAKTRFLAMVSGREDGVVVRVYPRMDVEKTDGVKQIVAEIAKQLKLLFPELSVGETNLNSYLN